MNKLGKGVPRASVFFQDPNEEDKRMKNPISTCKAKEKKGYDLTKLQHDLQKHKLDRIVLSSRLTEYVIENKTIRTEVARLKERENYLINRLRFRDEMKEAREKLNHIVLQAPSTIISKNYTVIQQMSQQLRQIKQHMQQFNDNSENSYDSVNQPQVQGFNANVGLPMRNNNNGVEIVGSNRPPLMQKDQGFDGNLGLPIANNNNDIQETVSHGRPPLMQFNDISRNPFNNMQQQQLQGFNGSYLDLLMDNNNNGIEQNVGYDYAPLQFNDISRNPCNNIQQQQLHGFNGSYLDLQTDNNNSGIEQNVGYDSASLQRRHNFNLLVKHNI
ncbi:hypothetical protein LINPERPRIM_LOCUS29921 [Linum perenne]